jgi:SulP family sulfate permease
MIDLIIKKPKNIKNDVLSGLTVALALIPEAIAFSFVAHVDPRIGLYAAFLMGLITAVIGGRPGMISGATGAVAVIFAPLVIHQSALIGIDAATGYLFAAVILMGLIQIVFGIFKLGKFVRLIPHPVMLGFVNGLAIIIFKSQLEQFYIGTGVGSISSFGHNVCVNFLNHGHYALSSQIHKGHPCIFGGDYCCNRFVYRVKKDGL